MSAKLVVLYAQPADPAAFDAHYRDVHVPLVEQLPDVQRWSLAKFAAAADGGDLPYYQIVELHFADADTVNAAFATEAGQAAVADYGEMAPEGSRIFVAVTDD